MISNQQKLEQEVLSEAYPIAEDEIKDEPCEVKYEIENCTNESSEELVYEEYLDPDPGEFPLLENLELESEITSDGKRKLERKKLCSG